jgi:glycosyltransferase involved in cell wall biosynthesis
MTTYDSPSSPFLAPLPAVGGREGVSLILPVHNECASVGETLRRCRAALDAWGGPWEIVVVDDGSTDGSGDLAGNAGGVARVIVHEENQGYGAALKTGFSFAQYPLVAFLDADGSYPPEDLPRLLEEAGYADMVVAQRVGYKDHSSRARRLGKAILHPLAEYLAQRRIPDLNSGMRVVRLDLIERYWPLLPDGFSLTTTITLALMCARRRVIYLPTPFHARHGHSKIRPVRDMVNFVLLILRTATYFRPLKVYLPASIVLVLTSVAVVLLSKWLTGKVMVVTSLFLFITGLQLLLIGVLADLILKILGTRPRPPRLERRNPAPPPER